MEGLVETLRRCASSDLTSAAATRRDLIVDAALRLWSLCVPEIAEWDADECAQSTRMRSTMNGAPSRSSLGRFRVVLTPRNLAELRRLTSTLEKIRRVDDMFSYVVSHKCGSVTVFGAGELHLLSICDRAQRDSNTKCAQGPLLSPTHGGSRTEERNASHTTDSIVDFCTPQGEPRLSRMQGAQTLLAVYDSIRHGGLVDAHLCGLIALRLMRILLEQENYEAAVDVGRTAGANIDTARSDHIIAMARMGLHGSPSSSCASMLPNDGGPLPYIAPADLLHQDLASLQVDILLLLFRAELRVGLHDATKKSQAEFDLQRAAQLKRRKQQHIYGVKSQADQQREDEE